MPIPAFPLGRGDRGAAVGDLHRTLESLNRVIDQAERDRRTFGPATEVVLAEFQKQSGLQTTGVFDADTHKVIVAMLADIGPFSVYGRLTDADGRPVAGATIVAVDVDLRKHEELGRASTDSEGDYEVRYAPSRFTRAEKGSADILVRAQLGRQRVGESSVLFNAPAEARIDLGSAGRFGPSELERLQVEVAPLLDGLPATDLTDADVEFLAGETGLDADLWRSFIRAHALAATVPAKIPLEAFYAWMRAAQPADWDALRAVRIAILRAALVDALERNRIPAGIGAEIEEILARIPNVERDRAVELLGASTLPPDTARTVLEHVDGIDAVTGPLLAGLIERNVITREDAHRVGLATSVQRLVGGTAATVGTILETEFPAVKSGRLQEAQDLAALDPADWAGVLERSGAPVPEGVSLESHARSRAIAVAQVYPDAAFRHRAARMPPRLDEQVDRLQALLESDKDALARDFDALDLGRIPPREQKALRAAHAEVRALVNAHPGLGLHEVFATEGPKAAATAATRVGWVTQVLEQNPDVRFLELNYLPDSPELATVDFGALPEGARDLVVADLRAQGRLHAVTGNVIAGQELMTLGFHSASALARTSVADLAARSGMTVGEAAAYREKAVELANVAALNWFGIYDLARDRATTPVRVIPTRQQFFRPLEGYARLMSDQPWCACDHCQSVLSPAAYFVDLMFYVEQHILSGSFAGQETHPLHLARRRPDLWDLPLTCANTSDYIPYLDVVNEILERYITTELPAGTSVYAHLAEQEGSFRQPFTLPIERLDVLLGHFKLARYDVARAMQAPRDVKARARLGLSGLDYRLITTERSADRAFLLRLFPIETPVTTADATIAPVDLAILQRATGLAHEQIVAAVTSTFVRGGSSAAPAVEVVLGKRNPTDVQNNSETVTNLTFGRMDRLHRFVRLWRRVPWTIAELDYVLGRLAPSGASPRIDADSAATPGTLERIVELLDANAEWDLPVDELLAIVDAFPARGLRETASLFDRLFNAPAFVERDGAWTDTTSGRFTHPSWSTVGAPGVSSPADNTLSRLLAGLQLSDQDFVELVEGLRADPALDYRAGTSAESESISISRASIASLYRHARVRGLLGASVEDFRALLRFTPRGSSGPVGYLRNVEDVQAVADFAAWQATSGFSLRDLAHLIEGIPSPAAPDPAALTRDIPAAIAAIGGSEALGLAGGPDPIAHLDIALGGLLGRSPAEVEQLRGFTAPLAAPDLAIVTRALKGSTAAADVNRLTALIADIVRVHWLLRRPVFDLAALTFVRANLPVFFDAPAAPAGGQVITIESVRRVVSYAKLATEANAGFTTAGPSPDLGAIQTVITSVTTASDAELARALGTDPARIAGLTPHLTLPPRPFDGIAIVQRALELADRLGVSGETLARMVDESTPGSVFDRLARAAEDVMGAFRAKYPEAKIFTARLEPYEDTLRGRKRDGLVDYIVTRWPVFSSPDRLYEYFLVDVMMTGCARTSRIVAAMSSVQLYVHRVLMNLERSGDWDGAARPPVGVYARFTDAARRREWQWRRHYRVWEANRKVFLYPENYIEPELRDDKTPLFVDLEDTLLMQEITTANVQDAYSRYLTGFDELARLKIAGAYYDAAAQTLHLFGVTQDDAPVYYYRAVDESGSTPARPVPPRFSAWHKLDLQIPVRRVSPFVFEGRLYVFWVETATRPVNTFSGGTSHFGGYRHTVRIKYSTLRPDGAWSAPQVIRFAEGGGIADSRIVEDPRDTSRVDAMKARLLVLTDDRPAREEARVKAAEALATATNDRILATADQVNKKAILDGPPNFGEVIAIGLLVGGGVPPHLAILLVRGTQHAIWLAAVDAENRAIEAQRIANDILSTALNRLAQLDKEIADLSAAIAAEQIHVRWDRSRRDHKDALDSYRPEGWAWDRVYPDTHNPPRPDLPAGTTGPAAIRLTFGPNGDRVPPPAGLPLGPGDFDPVSAVLREPALEEAATSRSAVRLNWASGRLQTVSTTLPQHAGQALVGAAYWLEQEDLPGSMVGAAPATAEVQVVGGYVDSVIVEADGDAVWTRKAGPAYVGMRLGTSLTRTLARAFWRDGARSLLDANFQQALTEFRSKISPVAGQGDPARQSPFHPDHPSLTYFRETFFHIPFVIADHLNTEQHFADAQQWYHYIFDPTAADGNAWRNRELREPDKLVTTLRELLVNDKALAAYRTDPFNPHAIARTRMSAYAKAIVMKYIDNLLDWADSLFAQFTMESVNEATMLYVMAQDILGPRPTMLGACHDDSSTARTYRTIRPGLGTVSDFLVELETPPPVTAVRPPADPTLTLVMPIVATLAQGSTVGPTPLPAITAGLALEPAALTGMAGMPGMPGFAGSDGPVGTPAAAHELESGHGVYWTSTGGTALTTLAGGVTTGGAGAVLGTKTTSTPVIPPGRGGAIDFVEGHGPGSVGLRGGSVLTPAGSLAGKYGLDEIDVKYDLRDRDRPVAAGHGRPVDRFEFDPVDVVPPKDAVFCIPPNQDLLAYWDRVEDGLLKIRNCMDISGARRRLELFAPEIDPRLLVRMQAAGLTIDDVLAATAGDRPPYRFTYLLDKAKQHASTVQSFGAQLLAALEKHDAEELNHLRAVHDQNLLQMRGKLARLEIEAAEDTIEGLRAQKEAVEYRRQHFTALREVGSIAQERKQQQLQREASQYRTAAGIAQVVASILTIIPDMGAPTAMKFGGSQLGAAGKSVSEGLNALAAFHDTAASMAGVEAANKRRDEEWKHQAETARREIAQIEKNITAAEIRRDMAVHALAVHDKTVSQTEEMFEFLRTKFSSVDRYRLLSKELRRLYRQAFNSALAMAAMAEQAYRAERAEDDELLAGNYWDTESAGLLAGERLLIDLQRLERQFVERNRRQLEVAHSFSLAQFAPDRLAELRVTGECTVTIPEWFFDLYYPGQLRRRIRAVRMTMPCVTGPYANVGATLRLESSRIRRTMPADPMLPLGEPDVVPQRQLVTIAASKAQNDAGVFDFSFRDERYMPFEGAGALSTWRIALPKTLRVFDYSTISDVVLHLDYTADYDERLAQRWDRAAGLVALLAADGADGAPPMARVFSLRHEFPDAYHRLITSTPGTEVSFTISPRHFSVFLAGHELVARTASLAIVTPLDDLDGARVGLGRKPPAPPSQFVTVEAPAAATLDPGEHDGLREFDCGSVFQPAAGGAGVSAALHGDYVVKISRAGALATAGAIDGRALHDIALRIGYRLAPA